MRTVLCYGDSNTHGTLPMHGLEDRRRLGPGQRWPGVMRQALGAGWQVVEEGLPGRTTVHPDPIEGAHVSGLAGLPIALASHRPVDLVVLKLGTNDLKARLGLPVIDLGLGLERLVNDIQASDAGPDGAAPDILLVAPPPIMEVGPLGEIFAGGAEKSAALGTLAAGIARRHGLAFLDAAEHIAVSPVDGVHYDAGAHAKLGRAIAEAVRGLALPTDNSG
ncbi:MAG: SGNH/GDSL hydrolase family protein [Pseudomonadota bacterium]